MRKRPISEIESENSGKVEPRIAIPNTPGTAELRTPAMPIPPCYILSQLAWEPGQKVVACPHRGDDSPRSPTWNDDSPRSPGWCDPLLYSLLSRSWRSPI